MESRPVRWASAINRATNAISELQYLRDRLITVREELEHEWTTARGKFDDALFDLISLQSEYAVMSVPENLSESRFQEKLYRIGEFDFESLRDKVPDLKNIPDPLKEFDPRNNDDFLDLDEAKAADLPKGYGRD
jgi:hypothetical protein